MQMLSFDRHSLTQKLATLGLRHKVAFAGACCERMLPSYKAFANEAGWGDFTRLRSAVDRVWELVDGVALEFEELTELISSCRLVVPDLDEITVPLATWGQDAASTVIHTLFCARDVSDEQAALAATMCHQAVDAFVQIHENLDPNDPLLEQRINEHPLMKRELNAQADVLSLLRTSKIMTNELALRVRHHWQNKGLSNIDLG